MKISVYQEMRVVVSNLIPKIESTVPILGFSVETGLIGYIYM